MPSPIVARRALRSARRMAPVAMELYRRWQTLSPEEKERYRAMVRRYADRGRYAYEQAQRRRQQRRGP